MRTIYPSVQLKPHSDSRSTEAYTYIPIYSTIYTFIYLAIDPEDLMVVLLMRSGATQDY